MAKTKDPLLRLKTAEERIEALSLRSKDGLVGALSALVRTPSAKKEHERAKRQMEIERIKRSKIIAGLAEDAEIILSEMQSPFNSEDVLAMIGKLYTNLFDLYKLMDNGQLRPPQYDSNFQPRLVACCGSIGYAEMVLVGSELVYVSEETGKRTYGERLKDISESVRQNRAKESMSRAVAGLRLLQRLSNEEI